MEEHTCGVWAPRARGTSDPSSSRTHGIIHVRIQSRLDELAPPLQASSQTKAGRDLLFFFLLCQP